MERYEGKVGERVRLKADMGIFDLRAGALGTLEEDNDGAPYVRFDDGGTYAIAHYNLELVRAAAWTPKVGDRVRVLDNKTNGGFTIDKYTIGAEYVVTKTCNDSTGRPAVMLADHYQYLRLDQIEPAPLKIEAGKFYRTRDGRKVGPMGPWGSDAWTADEGHRMYLGSGERYFLYDRGGPTDLIAEWTEPTRATATRVNVAATPDFQADEYGPVVKAAPKFKVGDRVRCPMGFGDATVAEVRSNGNYRVIWDEVGESTSWWADDDFELIAPHAPAAVTPTTAIVARIDNGRPKPNPAPFIHTTMESATKEAKRLAGVHKGKKFGVFVLTGEPAIVEKPTYKHEWQRLAAEGLDESAASELSKVSGLPWEVAHLAVKAA